MNNEPNEFQHYIDQLIPVVQAADFEDVFKRVTSDLTKPQQFQLKMQINELKKPCGRYIDLRGQVDGNVQPHNYADKTHYMDALAIKVFERELEHYGSFTMGVYERVKNTENNYRVRHQKERQQRLLAKDNPKSETKADNDDDDDAILLTHHASLVQFQSYAIRTEERMNFSINVELQLSLGEHYKAVTSDLSVSGCKIRLTKAVTVALGQFVRLHFKGLEEEFALGLSDGLEYEIVATDIQDHVQTIRMKRSYNENTHAFDEFLNNFINGNKRRYKINMENTEKAVKVKGYEQYYIPRITTLPLFIGKKDAPDQINSVLTTDNNKYVLHYWFNHDNHSVLPQVLNQKRLQSLSQSKESLLYSFTNSKNGRIFHYVALLEELENNKALKSLFFGFGAQKSSWRVHKIQLLDTDYQYAHIPLSLPDSASAEVKRLNKPPSPRVAAILQHTTRVVALTDITEFKENKQYQSFDYDNKIINQLKVFGVPQREPAPFQIVPVDYVNLRKETRFLYKTEILVSKPAMQPRHGYSNDFSTKGMQIVMSDPYDVEKNDVLLITLPGLQKITSQFKLNRLPYEVVMVNKDKTVINLRVYEHGDKHVGKKFFQQLIQSNRSKLNASETALVTPGLPLAMRNMYIHCCANMPFFIHRQGIRYSLDTIARGGQDNSLHQLMAHFKEPGHDYNSYPLTKNNQINTLFATVLKTMRRQDPPKTFELLISVKREQLHIEDALIMELSQELHSDHSHRVFVTRSLQKELFFCYRIMISRTGRPDVDYIAKELKYVGNYAIHRAKQLEEKLWSVIGVADAIDISNEVMMRYDFGKSDIQLQQQAKQFYFNG